MGSSFQVHTGVQLSTANATTPRETAHATGRWSMLDVNPDQASDPRLAAEEGCQEKPAKRDRRLTEDKGRKLLEAGEKTPPLYRLIVAALETGCRESELLRLQWRDVHLARGELVILAVNADASHGRSPRLQDCCKFTGWRPTAFSSWRGRKNL